MNVPASSSYVHTSGSKSDKTVGVIGLCMFELRRLGHVGKIALAGTNGKESVYLVRMGTRPLFSALTAHVSLVHIFLIFCVLSLSLGTKFPGIREHLTKKIGGVYGGLDTSFEG